jgi:hypothetical protein
VLLLLLRFIPFPSLSVFSVDGSVYFTFVKNKENINMTRWRKRRKDRLSFCTYIFSLGGCVRILLTESDDCRVVFFFFFSFSFSSLEKWMCRCRKDIFLFFFFLSFVWARPKKGRKKIIEKCKLSLVFLMPILRAFICCWKSFERAHVLYLFAFLFPSLTFFANTQMDSRLTDTITLVSLPAFSSNHFHLIIIIVDKPFRIMLANSWLY